MSGLPQELIDHIIDYVDDRDSLKACSLVCSQWSARSQKHLFVRADFSSTRNLQRWCARIRPGPSGLSSFVEELSISEYHPSSTLPSPSWLHSPILSSAASHFRSFSALRVLEICRWRMSTGRVSSMLHSLGSSLKNVTHLTLHHVDVHPSTLAMFVSRFPCLNHLSISGFPLPMTPDSTGGSHRRSRPDIVPTHPRGEFSVSGAWISLQAPKEIFEGITLLEPRFRRVSLTNVSQYAWRDYWPLIEACAGSLEELRILATPTDADYNGLSLACCPNLREIDLLLGTDRPCQFVEKCLSTITSTQLSKVSLRLLRIITIFRSPCSNLALGDALDIILHNLAGKYQPCCEGDKMLVEVVDENPDHSEAANFMWRYRQKGDWRVNSAT